jgi:hypothetical protein
MLITSQIHEFRETVRHLWNAYMRTDATWDTVDEFAKIAKILFCESVLCRAGIEARQIPMDQGTEVLTEYLVFAEHAGKLPLHANRDIPPSGYWDHPVSWIAPDMPHTIHPICFFDFDVRGWRRIQFYRVRIVECASNPELNGRDALIQREHVEIKVQTAAQRTAASRESSTAPEPPRQG